MSLIPWILFKTDLVFGHYIDDRHRLIVCVPACVLGVFFRICTIIRLTDSTIFSMYLSILHPYVALLQFLGLEYRFHMRH